MATEEVAATGDAGAKLTVGVPERLTPPTDALMVWTLALVEAIATKATPEALVRDDAAGLKMSPAPLEAKRTVCPPIGLL